MPKRVKCQDCGWVGHENHQRTQFPDIPDLFERIFPGEVVPTGECPRCGSLCHYIVQEEGKALEREDYDHWGEEPGYPVEDWKCEVANDDTRLGYEDWMRERKAA